ncbi:MAG: PH domain-containing protein [Lachnospiraceae bacterium]|nr:PH domain-containing protein [Lachnospiraceae bacterium]MBP5184887.1 PH domain-containing protein [Lachnospiraceae bacterium]
MIDFVNNSQIFKLKEVEKNMFDETVSVFYVNGEETIACYKAVRDYIVFTNKRMIVVNVQGLVGKKKEFSIFPYSKLQAFSVETAGVIDIDTDVDLVFAGLGTVHLEFSIGTNIAKLLRLISAYVL